MCYCIILSPPQGSSEPFFIIRLHLCWQLCVTATPRWRSHWTRQPLSDVHVARNHSRRQSPRKRPDRRSARRATCRKCCPRRPSSGPGTGFAQRSAAWADVILHHVPVRRGFLVFRLELEVRLDVQHQRRSCVQGRAVGAGHFHRQPAEVLSAASREEVQLNLHASVAFFTRNLPQLSTWMLTTASVHFIWYL